MKPFEIMLQKLDQKDYANSVVTDAVMTREEKQAFREEEARIITRFKSDLEEAYGMAEHPKHELLWSMAWERGHSSGLRTVLQEYDDLADLLR